MRPNNNRQLVQKGIELALTATVVLFVALLIAVWTAGCTSAVTPKPVPSEAASFDGNEQNSGVLSQDANGYLVTQHFRDRWTSLVRTYGRDFHPALDPDSGWEKAGPGAWRCDKQRMVFFLEMNAWLRAGLQPVNP